MNLNDLLLRLRSLAVFRYGSRPDPTRDWLLILAVAAVLTAASAGWNAWVFYTSDRTTVSGQPGQSVAPLDRNKVDAVKTFFDQRAQEEAKYRDGTYRFVDPSR